MTRRAKFSLWLQRVLLVGRIEVARVQPGDTVVYTTEVELTLEQIEYLRDLLRDVFPDGVRVLVITSDSGLEVWRSTS